jgi:hypothetical protein
LRKIKVFRLPLDVLRIKSLESVREKAPYKKRGQIFALDPCYFKEDRSMARLGVG